MCCHNPQYKVRPSCCGGPHIGISNYVYYITSSHVSAPLLTQQSVEEDVLYVSVCMMCMCLCGGGLNQTHATDWTEPKPT